jgi:hypothetical protein
MSPRRATVTQFANQAMYIILAKPKVGGIGYAEARLYPTLQSSVFQG